LQQPYKCSAVAKAYKETRRVSFYNKSLLRALS